MAASFVRAGLEAGRSVGSNTHGDQQHVSLYTGDGVTWYSRFDTLKLQKLSGEPEAPLAAGAGSVAASEDALWAAYLPLSGGTHMLNFFTYAVLRLLSETPMTPALLHQALEQADLQAGSVPLATVTRTLQDLDSAGLIYPEGRVEPPSGLKPEAKLQSRVGRAG